MIRTGVIWSAACIAIMLGVLIVGGLNLPQDVPIPTHFNAQGEPDGYSDFRGALTALAILPAVGLVLSLVMIFLPSIDPFGSNLRQSPKIYMVAWIGSMVLLMLVHALMAYSMVAGAHDTLNGDLFSRTLLSVICIFMIVLGNYLPKAPRNFFVGIRTPWTLMSEHTWYKTHRLGGLLLLLSGAIGLPFAVFGEPDIQRTMVAILVGAAAIFLVGYSFVVWRHAPDRRLKT